MFFYTRDNVVSYPYFQIIKKKGILMKQVKKILIGFTLLIMSLQGESSQSIYIRINQLGYYPDDVKSAVIISKHDLSGKMVEVKTKRIFNKTVEKILLTTHEKGLGNFPFHYRVDFSNVQEPGEYWIELSGTDIQSYVFPIQESGIYEDAQKKMLGYIQQQRCGYNPFLDEACHTKDGRSAYGPMPEGTFVSGFGGWHDAADLLQYMMTSSNTIGRLLLAYSETSLGFDDVVNALGQPYPNGIPDILDEAKWGLDWMLRLHPEPDQLYHQVGDDRDHIGFKYPYQDSSDYGWGAGSYRVIYYATGEPQGLGNFTNTSTGIANLAGRYAAVMARGARIWENDLQQPGWGEIFLQAGKEVYEMGKKQPGSQEGVPHKASYRYHEKTWADDMEWGAAELFLTTGDSMYLEDAKAFALKAGTDSWFGRDTVKHYEYYPFMNVGHYVLHGCVEDDFKPLLEDFYRQELESVEKRAENFPWKVGHPFVWCSNNLASALVVQSFLYERMTGDTQFRRLACDTRDWIFGKNPWGMSQVIEVGIVTPQHAHGSLLSLEGIKTPGGLLDGPLYTSTHAMHHQYIQIPPYEPFKDFQSDFVVYHDLIEDYATNEPTLDGTAEALFMIALSRDRK